MAKQLQLKAKTRTETGKTQVKRLRAAGVVPGVVYGPHSKPLSVTVAKDDIETLLEHASSGHVLVDLAVEQNGQTTNRLALLQDVQQHPYQDRVLHVDFREVSATEKMRTTVSIRPVGEPAGVKTGGGVLEFVMRELHVECLPKDLPDVIEVDVAALEIGQSISVGGISAPAGVTILDGKDMAVFIVAAPMAEEVAATTEGATAEPEVIGAKKEEGEEVAEGGEKKAEAAKPAAKPEAGKADAKAAPATAAKPAAAAKPEAKKK